MLSHKAFTSACRCNASGTSAAAAGSRQISGIQVHPGRCSRTPSRLDNASSRLLDTYRIRTDIKGKGKEVHHRPAIWSEAWTENSISSRSKNAWTGSDISGHASKHATIISGSRSNRRSHAARSDDSKGRFALSRRLLSSGMHLTNPFPTSTPHILAASTSSQPIIYAHEDLLSTSRTSSSDLSQGEGSFASTFKNGFFYGSSFTKRGRLSLADATNISTQLAIPDSLPPPSTSPLTPVFAPIPTALPPPVLPNGMPNPSIRWRQRYLAGQSLTEDLALYRTMSKFRLTTLVVLTAMTGYAMCPVDAASATAATEAFAAALNDILPQGVSLEGILTPAASVPLSSVSSISSSIDAAALSSNDLTLSVLLPAAVGTTLCAASAATFNQLIEAPYDAQMARTRLRPLPKQSLTPLHAATFGSLTGVVGLGTLYAINPLSAAIGLGTIVLYCPLYTISKRHTVYNTWLGAVVGALPPLIGWAACTDSLSLTTQPGAYALFLLCFFWQFPHFMSLAHTLRSSYASSGYRMLAVLDPAKNALVSLRYSIAIIPLSFLFPVLGMTNMWFPWLALIPNGAMTIAAWRFWRVREERRAKLLFWSSLIHLPAVLGLAMLCKKGLWDRWLKAKDEDDVEGDGTLPHTPSMVKNLDDAVVLQ